MYGQDETTYLYEIIEDYREAVSREEQERIFRSFLTLVWASPNKRTAYTKYIRFKVRADRADTELGKLFSAWAVTQYQYCRPVTGDGAWQAILRQKINNLYTRYFDREVILSREYMDLLRTPKRLYYEWISGVEMEAASVSGILLEASGRAAMVRERLQREKLPLTWGQYKEMVEGFLYRCFENVKLIDEYEDKSSVASRLDFHTEDHFYVRYFCKCLDGEVKNWIKRKSGAPLHSRKGYRHCKICGLLIAKTNNRSLYCKTCKHRMQLEWQKKSMKKARSSDVKF